MSVGDPAAKRQLPFGTGGLRSAYRRDVNIATMLRLGLKMLPLKISKINLSDIELIFYTATSFVLTLR